MEEVEEQSVHLPDGQDARVEGEGPAGESPKAVIAAVLANIAIGIVKFIAAFISGSSAMISEGIHSIVDSGNGLLILFGMKRAERKPDLAHPFGYSMELYFWTLVVAVMIFALGGGLSIYEGIERLIEITPDTKLGDPTLNYIVIAISAIIEGLSLRVALREFNAARGKVKPLHFIRDAKDPSLFTVVLEDSAALTGLLFAFLGTLLGHITGNPVFDGIASVLIGLLLAFVAVILLRETKGLLIGEGLQADEILKVKEIVESHENVTNCGRVLSLYLGPSDLLITLDVTFADSLERDDIDRTIDEMERSIVRAFPQTTRIFIEPENIGSTTKSARRLQELTDRA
ncbi:MAG: cation transporter [Eggerthellaceae bacterium]|nr:cation transporter [Eggerthellaceae bacterium]